MNEGKNGNKPNILISYTFRNLNLWDYVLEGNADPFTVVIYGVESWPSWSTRVFHIGG